MAEQVDVLFINPGDRRQIYQDLGDEFCAIEPPVFPGLFATYVRGKGLSAAIVDAPALGWSAEMVAESVTQDFDPTLIAIAVYGFQPSASTQNMSAAGRIATLIKEAGRGAKVLMTGTHPAALPERTMREEDVDFVCDLEGPVTIYKTARAIKEGVASFANIPSLWWRDEGRIVPPLTQEGLIGDLDTEMPGIAWDLVPMDRYRSHNWHAFDHIGERAPYAAIHTSLGCPYRCNFCCINAPFGKPSYRMWSPETVVTEIDYLVETHGVRNIKFVDEMFVLNKNHVRGICSRLAERDYDVNIWAYARVDTVKDELLDVLKAGGVNWLCLGIESASAHVRDGADKRLSEEDIIGVVRRIQNAGIQVLGNYIFGLPEDTMESMRQTLALAHELNCEFANFYSAMAYPGSQLHTTALAQGLDLPKEWHHYSQHAYETLPLSNDHCSSAEILAFRDWAWQDYFRNPGYLAMIDNKYGADVVEHIGRMAEVPLKRKLIDDRAAA